MGNNLPNVSFPDDFISLKIVAGYYFNCALSTNHSIVCWGANSNYQLGDGTTSARGNDANEMGDNLNPVNLGSNFVVSDIEAGGEHVCALSESLEAKCWGLNSYGISAFHS